MQREKEEKRGRERAGGEEKDKKGAGGGKEGERSGGKGSLPTLAPAGLAACLEQVAMVTNYR